jgi:hypothetical protein
MEMSSVVRHDSERDGTADLRRALRELRTELRRNHVVCLSRMTLSSALKLGTFKAAANELIRDGYAIPDATLDGVIRFNG